MNIHLVHNYYGSSSPSGEGQVLEAEHELLKKHGHKVCEFTRYSDEILNKGVWGSIKGGIATPWNPFAAKALRLAVAQFEPDVVHVHNTFPLISPAIFSSIDTHAARILTLHNYRLFCPAAIPMRSGTVCTECLDRHAVWPALQHGCYRNSRLATLPLATNIALHRVMGTWTHQVDAFIALTEFQRDLMIDAGLPTELVHVKPNFFPGNPDVITWDERMPSVVFVGRLSQEKGVESLVRAWIMWGSSAPELRIVGDGELRDRLKQLSAKAPQVPIHFLGQMENAAAKKEIARSRLLILPSEWFETFGLVILEAFASGTPAAVSDIGPLSSIVNQGKNGLVFSPANPHSLLETVREAWESEGILEHLGTGARFSFDVLYTEDVNYQMLMDIYQQAIEVCRERKNS